ncbi:hypothetical protein M407DRAFT_97307 [Tulasnella calospora MUT 4182]|uniref:Uncharacterized protein n=1 Tax=Tulasnella calospora MUT 4182 TaxID=1051891 RepID=A0A0C3QFJ3_9AGAM|nr:hypothetical protein M407DRAFT_97307 [Tulasnella calospora MUT 4182]
MLPRPRFLRKRIFLEWSSGRIGSSKRFSEYEPRHSWSLELDGGGCCTEKRFSEYEPRHSWSLELDGGGCCTEISGKAKWISISPAGSSSFT